MSQTTEIALDFPVTIDGAETRSLHMRRWKVADRLRIQRIPNLDDADREVRLMADLCGVPHDAILELDGADWQKVVDTYRGFTSTAKPTT